jgi:hypothetical protein
MIRQLPLVTLLTLTLAAPPAVAQPAAKPFEAIDRHALKAPPEAEKSLEALAAYLVKPAQDDKEKARAIYRWVTDRIAYDADAFFAKKYPDYDPEYVLKERKAVCAGYAVLFNELCKEAGIKATIVLGRTKESADADADLPANERHAWNAIRIDDEWHLVDSTWGAGGVNVKDKKFFKRFRDFYFMPPPEALVFTHFPRKANCQLLTEPISEKEFDRQPNASARYFEVGLTPAVIRKASEVEGFPGLVKLYEAPGTLTLKEVPLARTLKAGEKYVFRLEAKGFSAVIVTSGGRSMALARKGKLFEGMIIAPRGTIEVKGVVGDGRQVVAWGLLEYEGE